MTTREVTIGRAIKTAVPEKTVFDEFVLACPDPDPPDICEMLGWENDLPVGKHTDLEEPTDEEDPEAWKRRSDDTVIKRWYKLSLEERLRVTCEYKLRYATMMMKMREGMVTRNLA